MEIAKMTLNESTVVMLNSLIANIKLGNVSVISREADEYEDGLIELSIKLSGTPELVENPNKK